MFQEITGQDAYQFMTHFDFIREAGTAGETAAAAALNKLLGQAGLMPETETFEIPTHVIDEVLFEVTAPFHKIYPCAGYYDCGSTPKEGTEADFLYIEDGDEVALQKAKGKIVLVNGPVRPALYQKLIETGCAAFLTVAGTPLDKGVDRLPSHKELRIKGETPLQGGILHLKDAEEIVEKGAQKAFFKLRQHRGTAISQNIIVHLPGTDPAVSGEHLSLTAHYDSVPQGKGAYDNMAGCAMIYEVCKYFSLHPARRSLTFVWFGAEERGLLGSKAYAARHEEELKNCRMNLNVDLAGQLIGSTVFGVTAFEEVDEVIKEIARKNGRGITTKNQIWSSDSNSFAAKGIPAATLDRDGFFMHTRHDTLEYISPWSLERDAKLLCAIAKELADAEPFPFERRMKEEYLEQLNKKA